MLIGIVGGLYVVSVVWQDEIQNKNVILPKLSCQKITKGQKEVTKNYIYDVFKLFVAISISILVSGMLLGKSG